MSSEEFELQQDYLTDKSDRQQEVLRQAQHTDAAITAIIQGNPIDVVHDLVMQHPDIANAMYMDMAYYKSRKVF